MLPNVTTIQCVSQCALEKNLSALILAHVIPIAWKDVSAVSTRCAIRLEFFENHLIFQGFSNFSNLSVMVTLMKTKISTDAKIVSQQNWLNALQAAAEVHLVSLVARQIMKMDLKIVHVWRAVLRDVPVLNGTAATFHFTCSD